MSFGRGAFTSAPSTVTEPAEGASMPPICASSVLLPQPEGPSRQTNSPWRIVSETSSSAVTVRAASAPTNVIDTRSIVIMAECAALDALSRVDRSELVDCSAGTSEFYRHELVVVDHLGVRDEVEDAEILQRIADDVDGFRIPGAVGGEAANLGIVDLGNNALADFDHAGAGLHRGCLV